MCHFNAYINFCTLYCQSVELSTMLSPFLKPLFDTRLFSLVTRLVVTMPFQALRQIFLELFRGWSFGIVDLQLFVVIVGVFVILAVVQVFHQLRGRIANL